MTDPDERNAFALIVGISAYQDNKIPGLNCTIKDARAIYDILINPDMAGFDKENVKLLLDAEATLRNIKHAISNWLYRNAGEDSIVIIYFAGHGGVEEDRFGVEKDKLAKYLLPYDTMFDNFSASALSNSEFNRFLNSIRSRRLVVFMDTCYSGGVTEKKGRDVKILEDPYEKMAKGEGRLVIAASQKDQRSFEDTNLGYGIFTYHLIEALSGAADVDDDGYVKAMEVYNYLSENVPKTALKLAGGLQEPVLRGDLKTDFILTVNRKKIEERKKEKERIKEENLKKLSDWYHNGEIGPYHYDVTCQLLESDHEGLNADDKKVLKSLNDLLVDKISISTFLRDFKLIKKLKEPPEPENLDELNISALKMYEEGKYDEAITEWQEVLRLEPGNEEAIEGIEKAKKKKSEEEDRIKINEITARAKGLFEDNKYDEAITDWQEVLRLEPGNEEAIEGIEKARKKKSEEENRIKINEIAARAKRLHEDNKYDEAIAKWQEVLRLEPGNKGAIEGIEKARKKKSEEENRIKINEIAAMARRLFEEKKYSEAIGKWREVLELEPGNQDAISGIEESTRHLKQCPKCSKQNNRELNYCTACGAKLFEKEKPTIYQIKYCPECNYKDDRGLEFCPECGTSFRKGGMNEMS